MKKKGALDEYWPPTLTRWEELECKIQPNFVEV